MLLTPAIIVFQHMIGNRFFTKADLFIFWFTPGMCTEYWFRSFFTKIIRICFFKSTFSYKIYPLESILEWDRTLTGVTAALQRSKMAPMSKSSWADCFFSGSLVESFILPEAALPLPFSFFFFFIVREGQTGNPPLSCTNMLTVARVSDGGADFTSADNREREC